MHLNLYPIPMKRNILTLILFFGLQHIHAQLTHIPLSNTFTDHIAPALSFKPHTTIQPYNPFEHRLFIDSMQQNLAIKNNFTTTWLGGKLLNENLANVKHPDYQFIFNPILDLRLGQDNIRAENLFVNTRGLQFGVRLGENFIFYSDFYENQAQFPGYLNRAITETNVVPGQGIPKTFGKNGGRDYAYVNGYFDFQANKFLNFRLGYGKNFWGDGYRSLLLSDNAFNYPYLRMSTTFWKIKYVNLFTQMLDINDVGADDTYIRKYVTSHILSAEITPKLSVALFESTIYHDSTGTRGYDLNYLNPFILYRPVEFALSSGGGNVILGGNVKYELTNNLYAYGQVLLDEFLLDEFFGGEGWWGNKYSFQIGFKSFNTFVPNLMIQSEFNYVRPYTYTHGVTYQNYGHYNQGLAHPLGANFMESVSLLRYRYKRFFFETQIMYAVQGKDRPNVNLGSDIYLSNDTREQSKGNEILQGIQATTLLADTKLGILINPSSNLRFELGYLYRKFTPDLETASLFNETTHYFHVGLVTRLNNQYYDF